MEYTMAGQPPEPSFQPSGQDQALTQGRPAWQQPSYSPPPGSAGQQQGQGYPPPPSYTPQDQSYAPQDQGYGAQDQTFTNIGSGAQAPGQEYQGYQAPGYAPAGGAGMPQWQGIAGVTPAASRPRGEKGFIGSLFDFSFDSFVTPKIIKVLYILLTVWTLLVALFFLIIGFRSGGIGGGIAVLIIVDPIFILLTLGVYRVVLEAFMVVFRIYEDTKKIREKTESQA
ncbi:MAG TPA: DUF4282 domain-containing protein [Trebonia sp.]|nr:DUF4282 domain-containing protein [Trebonia sp.]